MLESIELNETGIEMDDFFYNKKSGYVYSHKVTLDNLLPGYYAIEFFNGTGYDWNLNYKVSWHSGFAQNLSIPSNVSLKAGTNKTINMLPIPADSIIGINGINVSKSVDVEINGNRLNISANTVGAYTLKLRLLNGKTVSIKINVTKPDSPKLKYTTYKLNTGNSFTNKLLYTSKKVTWSSSNKKVATVSRKGKITAKGPGNCKIYAKIGKKKYICTVKVIRQQPDFYACITDYNRAGNYFKVRIKNNTKKSLIIYSSNAKAIDSDYSSFNRKLRLKNNKNITIKAKKETTIKFYVRGHRTWPNYNDFSILYSVKFDGKTYKCNTGSFWSEYVGSEKPTYKNAPQYYTWAE